MSYPRFPETLDADEPTGKDFTFEITLLADDSLTVATAELVDETSTTVIVADPLIAISGIVTGQVTEAAGNVWGISLRAHGLGSGGTAFIRFEYQTALGNGDHATRRLIIEQR